MNLERGSILFNRTIDQCRSIVAVVVAPVPGTYAHVRRHVRWRVPVGSQPEVENARQAIERIDAQCPWLKGCEGRGVGRPE